MKRRSHAAVSVHGRRFGLSVAAALNGTAPDALRLRARRRVDAMVARFAAWANGALALGNLGDEVDLAWARQPRAFDVAIYGSGSFPGITGTLRPELEPSRGATR
ncbi:MAG: hypothetical protein R3B99_32830 [Polyangiales bacterium]